jgi:hypothetical protein
MSDNNLKKIIALSAIVVALSISYQSYEYPKTLKSEIIPRVSAMNNKETKIMQDMLDRMEFMESQMNLQIGEQCIQGCRY